MKKFRNSQAAIIILNWVNTQFFPASIVKNTYFEEHLRTAASVFKGALSDLRQFLATESPLKVMKNAFYFTFEALFVLEIFKLLFFFYFLTAS